MTGSIESTIDKILHQTQNRMGKTLDDSLDEAHRRLDDSVGDLKDEYDRIISDGRKEADKLERQIVGSADLEGRNRQLVAVEKSVDEVFSQAISHIRTVPRDDAYEEFCRGLLEQAIGALGTKDIVVYTNDTDRKSVLYVIDEMRGPTLSNETISCLGGIRASTPDGTVSFDNTLDARIERLKPLIRKNIADKFGVTTQ